MGQEPDESRPPTEQPPEAVSDPDDEGDFAEEHTSATFADQLRGGLEKSVEPETPRGYSGMDRDRVVWNRGDPSATC